MFQETTTWDLRHAYPPFSDGLRVYTLFLFSVGFVYLVKLTRVWRNAPPLRLSRQKGNLAYVRYLEDASSGLNHWMGLIPLVWGIYASTHLYNVCAGLQMSKVVSHQTILFILQDFSTGLSMTLLVMLFLFLVRWHLLRRVQFLSRANKL